MKKIIASSLVIITALSGLSEVVTNISAVTKNTNAQQVTNFFPKNKLTLLKSNQKKKVPNPTELPNNITENDVTSVNGTGQDANGNYINLNLSKDIYGNYYFDDQTNNTRIQVSDYNLMGSFYTTDNRLSDFLRLGNISSDSYKHQNDEKFKKGIISSENNIITNKYAVHLYKTIEKNLEYYKDTFNYHGTNNDGKNNKLLLIANAQNNTDRVNAQMVPELNGDGTAIITGIGGIAHTILPNGERLTATFDNLAMSDSLIAHEYGHRVASNLMGKDAIFDTSETRASKEAIADMFAVSENKDWQIAFDISKTDHENYVVGRDLSNPSKYIDAFSGLPYPDKYSDLNNGDYEFHNMGTILGKAYYLISEGGDFNGISIKGIGLNNAEQLLYKAAQYLGKDREVPLTGFSSIRSAFEKASTDYYPQYFDTVENAFDSTEVPTNSFNK